MATDDDRISHLLGEVSRQLRELSQSVEDAALRMGAEEDAPLTFEQATKTSSLIPVAGKTGKVIARVYDRDTMTVILTLAVDLTETP